MAWRELKSNSVGIFGSPPDGQFYRVVYGSLRGRGGLSHGGSYPAGRPGMSHWVHDVHHPRRNCTFDQLGNMRARNPSRSADARACLDHLSWRRPGGPFISFFTSWNAALHWRQWMIKQGATEVVIVAVWLEGLPGIYDAFMMARALGFKNQRLDRFLYEVLVYGGVSADSYRVLAMFHGI